MAPCSLTGRPAAASRSRCAASSSAPWNTSSRRLRPPAPRRGIILIFPCARFPFTEYKMIKRCMQRLRCTVRRYKGTKQSRTNVREVCARVVIKFCRKLLTSYTRARANLKQIPNDTHRDRPFSQIPGAAELPRDLQRATARPAERRHGRESDSEGGPDARHLRRRRAPRGHGEGRGRLHGAGASGRS